MLADLPCSDSHKPFFKFSSLSLCYPSYFIAYTKFSLQKHNFTIYPIPIPLQLIFSIMRLGVNIWRLTINKIIIYLYYMSKFDHIFFIYEGFCSFMLYCKVIITNILLLEEVSICSQKNGDRNYLRL